MFGVLGLAGLVRVVVVLERHVLAFEEDLADLTDREFLAVLVADVDHAEQRLAHRAGMIERLLRADERRAGGLGRCVVLVDDRAPPLDHRPLHLDGAGRGRVDGDLHAADVVLRADVGGQLEHPDEHGGHPLAVGHAILLDGGEGRFGIEPVHHDHGPADRVGHPAIAQRRCVIQRCGGQVDRGVVVAVHGREDRGVGVGHLVDLPFGHRCLDALRTAGGPGGVEHVGAARLVGAGLCRRIGQDLVVTLEAVEIATPHDAATRAGEGLDLAGGRHGLDDRGAGEQDLRVAVGENVVGLRRGEVVVDRGHVQTAAQGRPVHLEDVEVVGGDHGDVVAAPESEGVEVVGEPCRVLVQLSVGQYLAGGGPDDGRLVGGGFREDSRKQE